MYDIQRELNKYFSKEVHHRTLDKYWYGVDSKKNFDRQVKTQYSELKEYITIPITYTWNRDKFRSNFEFTPNKDLKVDIYLGCSHTMGTGHYWENTWPYHVSKYTGNEIVNLGVGGKGIELSFINLAKYIKYFNVQNIFHFQPIYARYNFPYKGEIGSVLVQNVDLNNGEEDYVPWRKKYIKEELLNDDYIVYNHYKHTLSIQGLCNTYSIPYYHMYKLPDTRDDKSTLKARDLVHYNSTQLKAIANEFLSKMNTTNGYNQILDDLKW